MKIEIPDRFFNKEELKNTPERYKKFLEEWLDKSNHFEFVTFPNPNYKQMIILKDIRFASLCAHHLLPFKGKAHFAYIPKDRICGISKIARVVDKFSHRPQLQEKLTQEVADFLDEKLSPIGLSFIMEAKHDCMQIRGIRKNGAKVVTSAIKGCFKDFQVRQEFFTLLKNK